MDCPRDEYSDAKNPCLVVVAPINVISATGDEIVFEINRSKRLEGCRDETVTLNRVDDKTLLGTFYGGSKKLRELTLTKK